MNQAALRRIFRRGLGNAEADVDENAGEGFQEAHIGLRISPFSRGMERNCRVELHPAAIVGPSKLRLFCLLALSHGPGRLD